MFCFTPGCAMVDFEMERNSYAATKDETVKVSEEFYERCREATSEEPAE